MDLERKAGFKRVLFLGGSTTYDWRVARPSDTYPAQVGRLLEESLPKGVAGVEVINGGLPFGTSAEMLAHYHFKFHYFRADLVVLEAGGNDAWAQKVPFYHPDYAHWRQPLVDVPMLSPFGRALLRSRLLSLLLVPSFGGAAPTSFSIVRSRRPSIQWFELPANGELSDADNAFLHNTATLVDLIRRDGAEVVLLPWRGQPGTHLELQPFIERNETLLWRIARDRNLVVAPFPASVISPANWADRGHLNQAGALEKARHVAPFVRTTLFGEAAPARPGAWGSTRAVMPSVAIRAIPRGRYFGTKMTVGLVRAPVTGQWSRSSGKIDPSTGNVRRHRFFGQGELREQLLGHAFLGLVSRVEVQLVGGVDEVDLRRGSSLRKGHELPRLDDRAD